MGPSRLVKKDLGTQMDFVLACGELITSLAQVSFFGFLSKYELIDKFGLRLLPFGQTLNI
jgi:hypothetical protein